MTLGNARNRLFSARPGYRRLLAAGAGAALLWLLAAWDIVDRERAAAVAAALAHESAEVEQIGAGIGAGIEQVLASRRGVAAALAADEHIRRVLRAAYAGAGTPPAEAAALAALNRFLAGAEKHLAVGALWVGDAAGKGFAAANAGSAASPIGIDYSDRLYYRQAKAGQPGMQFAVGRTTRIPGMFFSAPVMEGDRFLGFVVVKIDLPSLATWMGQAEAFLVDNHGVVVLARDKALEMRTLPGADVGRIDAATRLATYRRNDFAELSIAPWDAARYPSLQRLDAGSVPVILHSLALPEFDLRLTVTRPFPQLAEFEGQRRLHFAFLAALGLLVLAAGGASVIYIGDMQHSRRLLARQKQQLDEAQQLANLGSWELDLAADSLIWSEASHRIFENATRASNYQGFLAAIHPDDRATVDQAYRDSVARHAPGEIVHRVLLADGRIKYVHVRWQTRYDASGKALRSLGSVQDVTERKALEAQQRLAASVFESAHEGICITDPAERIIDVNATFCETTGYARADVIGKTPRLLKAGRQSPEFYAAMWRAIAAQGHWQGEVWNRRRDGSLFAARLTISAVRDPAGAISHYVGVLSDITATKEHEERLERIAHYDALTGIPNRSLLADRMRQAIAQTGRSAGLLAVCYLDLDGFKAVNDSLGHEAGDRLLVETAFRLRYCVRAGDTVARLGGDEFVLLLLGLAQTEECEAALQRILEALNRPVEVAAGHSTHISASIGVTLYPKDNTDADTLLRHADHAMYQAKQKGKNRYEFFAATTNDKPGSPD